MCKIACCYGAYLGSVMLHHDSEGMGNGPLLCGKLLVCLEPFELVGEAGDDHVRVRHVLAIEFDVGDLPDLRVGVDSVNWLITGLVTNSILFC